jgi:predicted dehydrogenase
MHGAAKKNKVNIGILGAGKMARWHLRAYASNPYCRVAAICNPHSSKGELLAGKFGIPNCFKNDEELLSCKGLDGVDISVPTGLHADLVCRALDKGLNVYVEKPLCRTLEEADRIVACNAAAHRIVFTGFNLRFCKEFIRIKEILDSGELGDVRCIMITRGATVGTDSYIFNPSYNAGIITELSSHSLDLLRWWGFRDIARVHAEGTNVFRDHPRPDSVCLTLNFTNGACAIVLNSYAMPGVSTEVRILGSRKSLLLRCGKIVVHKAPVKWSIPQLVWITFRESMIMPFRILTNPLAGACNHFIECIRKDHSPLIDEIEGRENVRLAALLTQSFTEGKLLPCT